MTVCLLLAAGSSSRMGKAKMLLNFSGKTFLQHAIDVIKDSVAETFHVVTGCYHQELEKILTQQQTSFVENKNWQEGMGSSILTGINSITQQFPNAQSIIIIVCDQPFISSALINELIATHRQTGKGIVTSIYNGTVGTPVLFSKKYFSQLSLLHGQSGAKKIIQQHLHDVAEVNFPDGAIDIDTEEDYKKLVIKKQPR